MIFRSIRWTILFWYALILGLSLAALGWALLAQLERNLYRDADAQIAFWSTALMHAVEEYPAAELGGRMAALLPPGATFAVWDDGGSQVAASPDAQGRAAPSAHGIATRKHVRERHDPLPRGGWLLVGKNVEDEHHRVRDFLVVLLIASAAIVVVALGGGWFLVSRSLAPLDRIAKTARRISAENLGERIPADRIHNELADLARTLNESFDRLEAAVERQSRFVADASHELRTPLAIARSHLELARTEDRTVEALRDRVAIVAEAALRMQSLVEQLLALALIDAGETTIPRARVDLAAAATAAIRSVEASAGERAIAIRPRLAPVAVFGDAEMLETVIRNLLTNAVRYNREGGEIAISLALEGKDAVLRVADTGIGIAEVDQARVFERFFRADPARSRAQGGAGLGLSIARHLVELHGGTIELQSRPGEGSTFTVRLAAIRP